MANVEISSLSSPELVFAATESIIKAQRAIAQLTKFTTDFSADAAQPGSTMMIQFFDDGEASEFDLKTNNYGDADGTTSFVPVRFGHHLKKSFAFTPQDFIAVNGTRFWEKSGQAASRAITRGAFKAVSKIINRKNVKVSGVDKHETEDGYITGTQLSFGSWNEAVFSGSKFSKDIVATKCREFCDAAEIDPAESVLLLNGKAYGEVLSTLDANLYGGPEAIRSGMIEGLYGFGTVMLNDQLGGDGENLLGAIVPANALGIAGRVVPILNSNLIIESGTVTDENSRLTIQFRRIGDANTDSSTLTAEALFGAKLLQPTKVVRIVSQATTPVEE